ncbi:UDP-glycosyltransferase 74G1-like [Mercurialis annua]|uniref:UDP-glycosyltransferase 74G1-like n=1 Tax=Mercurialis annua TaxID=3986 RepID=UPI00215F6CE4|nr:UDP-glycosyltransferase 74G1-like [Mercurialis annua]
MAEKQETPTKPHVLILPYPAQGHINPMLQFAKRLVSKGLKSTLANTIAINKSMHSNPKTLIEIETYSDGYDEGGYAQAESAEVYLQTLEVAGSKSVAELIKKLGDSGQPVTAIIYDGFMPWALDVAKKFGIVAVVFLTQACSVNVSYYCVQMGLLEVPVVNPTVALPGLPVFRVSELPSFLSDYGSHPGFGYLLVDQFRNIGEADWVLCNTFYNLEEEVVDWMAKKWRLRTVGPTLPSKYLDKRLEDDTDYGIHLYKPDSSTCIHWLQTKPTNSVVYVSFGSMADLGAEQMEELAFGLKSTKYYFLWVVKESGKHKLPDNCIDNEKGLVVTWCPQLEVLAHDSVGCFVTHCGLNSVLEALCLGVPIVALPQWSDQPTNAKMVEDVWKVGIRAPRNDDGVVQRESVERCVREVMEGDKGRVIKENAMKWKILAKEAVDEGGSSDRNIDELVAKLNS